MELFNDLVIVVPYFYPFYVVSSGPIMMDKIYVSVIESDTLQFSGLYLVRTYNSAIGVLFKTRYRVPCICYRNEKG